MSLATIRSDDTSRVKTVIMFLDWVHDDECMTFRKVGYSSNSDAVRTAVLVWPSHSNYTHLSPTLTLTCLPLLHSSVSHSYNHPSPTLTLTRLPVLHALLTPELNRSAQRCLPRILLVILILKRLTARRLYKLFGVKGLSTLRNEILKKSNTFHET
jgi:hypothetical protein